MRKQLMAFSRKLPSGKKFWWEENLADLTVFVIRFANRQI